MDHRDQWIADRDLDHSEGESVMMVKFGNYNEIATAEESYLDGFNKGNNWRWNHVPSGPHILAVLDKKTDIDWYNYCLQTSINNREWLRGWNDGQNQKGSQ